MKFDNRGPDPRGRGETSNFSAKSMLENSTAALLTAKDVKGNACEIHVYRIRHNTNRDIRASILLDIEPVNGKTIFPVNVTNLQRLAELVGDDVGQVVGKIVQLGRITYDDFGDGWQIMDVMEPKTETAGGKKK